MLNYQVSAGKSLSAVVEEMVAVANQEKKSVRARFQGVEITVNPNDDPQVVVADSSQRVEAYRNSPEGKSLVDAQKWLGFLRNGTDRYDSFIGYVREEARKGNLSLADIGTSEEELEELRVKKNAPKTSRRLLEDFRGRRMIDMP